MSQELMLNPDNPEERRMMMVERNFALIQRRAMLISQSTVIPKEYVGNIPNCVIAMEMAKRLGTGELEIMQNLYVIHGRPSFSAKYLIARVNNSGILKGRLRFVMEDLGKKTVTGSYVAYNKTHNYSEDIHDYRCRAIGIDAATDEELVGPWISIEMSVHEQWYLKAGSKWRTLPEVMLQYRAASFWANINAPDATMGMSTAEEVSDISEKDITSQGETITGASSVQDMINQKKAESVDKEPFGGDAIDVEPEQVATPAEIIEAAATEDATEEKVVVMDPAPDSRPWPREDDGFWHDSAGVVYDHELHGWSDDGHPAVKDDGTFKKKRVRKAKEVGEVAPNADKIIQETENPEPAETSDAFDTFKAGLNECMTPNDFIEVCQNIVNNDAKLLPGEKDSLRAIRDERKNFLKNNPAP